MSSRVAIIGGGFYGCAIASVLSNSGFQCTIHEKNHDLLYGTANKNIYRIHKGPHYPRSIETAKQCIDGYDRFVKKFEKSICKNYSN